jgi:hypothetical protein
MEHLFLDAIHGSTVKGASNAEPQPGTDSYIAAIKKLGFAEKVVSARRKTSAPLLLPALQALFLLYYEVLSMTNNL